MVAASWIVLAVFFLTSNAYLKGEATPFVIPFRQVETSLISNLTDPDFPASNSTFVGSVPYRVRDSNESVEFVLQVCLQAHSEQDIPSYPFLFWFEDLGRSSLLSMFMESGSVVLSGDRAEQRKYVIENGSNPLNSRANVVYVDLLGSGLSSALNSNDSLSRDIKTTAQQIAAFVEGFFQQLKLSGQSYYVAGRGYSSAAVVRFAAMCLR